MTEIKTKTPPCRVLHSFEPANAGWEPPRGICLGRSLTHHNRDHGSHLKRVGSKPVLPHHEHSRAIPLYHISKQNESRHGLAQQFSIWRSREKHWRGRFRSEQANGARQRPPGIARKVRIRIGRNRKRLSRANLGSQFDPARETRGCHPESSSRPLNMKESTASQFSNWK